VGHGFPSLSLSSIEGNDLSGTQTLVKNLSNALLNARAVLYKIDPAPIGAGNLSPDVDHFDAAVDDSVIPFNDGVTFDTLVHQTGGHSFFNRNDVDAEVQRAVSLGGTFYTLTYTPTHASASPSPYRHIHVTFDQPGLHAATRLGYFLVDTATPSNVSPNTAVDAAMISGLDYTALRLTASTCTLGPATVTMRCTLQIDTRNLQWMSLPDGDRTASLLVAAAAYTAAHKPISYTRSPVTLHMSADKSPARASFEITLHAPSQPASLRFVVLAEPEGRLGSASWVVASKP
jgi:hypothetical protein